MAEAREYVLEVLGGHASSVAAIRWERRIRFDTMVAGWTNTRASGRGAGQLFSFGSFAALFPRTLSFGSLSVASLIAVLVAISQADPVFVIAFGVMTLFVLVAIARVIRRACLDRALVTFETDQRGTIRMANGQALPFTITR